MNMNKEYDNKLTFLADFPLLWCVCCCFYCVCVSNPLFTRWIVFNSSHGDFSLSYCGYCLFELGRLKWFALSFQILLRCQIFCWIRIAIRLKINLFHCQQIGNNWLTKFAVQVKRSNNTLPHCFYFSFCFGWMSELVFLFTVLHCVCVCVYVAIDSVWLLGFVCCVCTHTHQICSWLLSFYSSCFFVENYVSTCHSLADIGSR